MEISLVICIFPPKGPLRGPGDRKGPPKRILRSKQITFASKGRTGEGYGPKGAPERAPERTRGEKSYRSACLSRKIDLGVNYAGKEIQLYEEIN